MKALTLTKAQHETLGLVASSSVTMVKTGYAAFRIQGASPVVTGRLVAMGLARWPKGPVGEQTCEVTEAGRLALSEVRHGE